MKNPHTLMFVLLFALFLTACSDSPNNPNDPATTSITSGTAVASARPASTGSDDSPVVEIISYTNVAAPGGSLSIEVNFTDYDGNVEAIIIAERWENSHNVIPVNAGGIPEGDASLNVVLSLDLEAGNVIEFYVGLVDEHGNISNYQLISIQLSEETQYGITAYSGDSAPDLSGTWDTTRTVSEPSPGLSVGDTYSFQTMFQQSGNDMTMTDELRSYNGTISGNSQFITITLEGTKDLSSQGLEAYIDFQVTLSGEMINANEIVGKSNTIILDVHGRDADRYQVWGIQYDITMTKDGFLGDGTGEGGNSFSTATPISIGTVYNKEIDSSTDIDYFVFTANSEGAANATITGLSADLDLIVYDSNQSEIGHSWANGTADEQLNFPTSTGETYYVKVEGYQGATSPYDMEVTVTN